MTIFLLLVIVGFASANVIVRGSCPTIDAGELGNVAIGTQTLVHLVDEPMMRMQAWTAARILSSTESSPSTPSSAFVVVGCQSTPPVVGVAFDDFSPGMDCGERVVAELFSKVDAMDASDQWTVKMVHVLAHLTAWRRERYCSIGSEQMRAGLFWIVVVIVGFIVRVCLRRRADLATRSPAKRH